MRRRYPAPRRAAADELRAASSPRVGAMQVRRVGDSGLVVSRLGLGTLTWGRDTDEEHARGLLEAFCEAGGTPTDTAAGSGSGYSERLVGRLVDQVSHGDDVVIASKAGFVVRRGERVVDTS